MPLSEDPFRRVAQVIFYVFILLLIVSTLHFLLLWILKRKKKRIPSFLVFPKLEQQVRVRGCS